MEYVASECLKFAAYAPEVGAVENIDEHMQFSVIIWKAPENDKCGGGKKK